MMNDHVQNDKVISIDSKPSLSKSDKSIEELFNLFDELSKPEECSNLFTLSSMNSLDWSDFELEEIKRENGPQNHSNDELAPFSMNSINYSDFEHNANEFNETNNQSSKLQIGSPSCPELVHTPHSNTYETSECSSVLCRDAATSPLACTESTASSVCSDVSVSSLVERTSQNNSAVPSHFELFRIINKLSSHVDELETCLKDINCKLNQNVSSPSLIESPTIIVPSTQQCSLSQSVSHANQDNLGDDQWIHVKNGPSRELTRELIPNYLDQNKYSPLSVEDDAFPSMRASEYVEILGDQISNSISDQPRKPNRRPLITYNEAYVENMRPVAAHRGIEAQQQNDEVTLVVSDSLSRNIRVGSINKLLEQHSDVKSLQESVRIDKLQGATADKIAHCSKFSIENLKPVQLHVIAGTNDISYSNGQIDSEILAVRILTLVYRLLKWVSRVCLFKGFH